MNVFEKIQARLTGSPGPARSSARTPGGPPHPRPCRPPQVRRCVCPECGGDASEVTDADRTVTRLACPDCGLAQRIELLSG